MIFQEPMTALNPVMRVGDQIAEAPLVHLGLSRTAARERALDLMQRVGIPDPVRRARRLPARALGRHAPAHHDRHRALVRPEADPVRRADDGARRHDPGSDPEAASQPAARARRERGVRHARPRGGCRDMRAAGGHVRRADRRDRHGRRGVPSSRGIRTRSGCCARFPTSTACRTRSRRSMGRRPTSCCRRRGAVSIPAARSPRTTASRASSRCDRSPQAGRRRASTPTRVPRTSPADRWWPRMSDPLLEVRGVHMHFMITDSITRRARRIPAEVLQAVDGVDLDDHAGRGARARRRVRLWQVDARALHRRPATCRRPARSVMPACRSGDKRKRSERRRIQMVFQDPYSSLNPRMTVRQTLSELLRVHKLTPRAAIDARCRELLDLVGLPGPGARLAPAQLLGRPAPAGLDRSRARARAGAAGRRRARVGARRVGAGDRPQPARRPAPRAGARRCSSSPTTWRWCATCATALR